MQEPDTTPGPEMPTWPRRVLAALFLWVSTLNLRGLLREHWIPALVVLIIACVALLIWTFWGAITGFLLLIVQAWLILIAVIFGGYVAFALATAIVSIPFVFVLMVYGAFQHPKELNTVRMGRSVLATGFVVILGGIYADALQASFPYGALDLNKEIVRGYSWIAVALLSVGYMRALYGEGLSAYTNEETASTKTGWGLLLQPAFVLSIVVFDLLVPTMLSLSVLINFRCDGGALVFEVFRWILTQFAFLLPILTYIGEVMGDIAQIGDILQWLSGYWRGAVDYVANADLTITALAYVRDSAFLDAFSSSFSLPACEPTTP